MHSVLITKTTMKSPATADVLLKLFSPSPDPKSGKCMKSSFFSAKSENVPKHIFTRFFSAKSANIPGIFHKVVPDPQNIVHSTMSFCRTSGKCLKRRSVFLSMKSFCQPHTTTTTPPPSCLQRVFLRFTQYGEVCTPGGVLDSLLFPYPTLCLVRQRIPVRASFKGFALGVWTLTSSRNCRFSGRRPHLLLYLPPDGFDSGYMQASVSEAVWATFPTFSS